MSLVHLHRHSEWSLLDGVGTGEVYAELAAELGQSALAITDHGTLAGALYHIEACDEVGIKPIVGMEAYFHADVHAAKEAGNRKPSHLVLLAKNLEGFKNLMRLSTTSYQEDHFYQKPNIDWTDLRKYSKGLIASSSCAFSELSKLLLAGDTDGVDQYIRVMRDIFREDFVLEIQPHDFDLQYEINPYILSIANSLGIPVIATGDTHYPHKDWMSTQQVMFDMRGKKKTGDDEEGKAGMTAYPTTWLHSEDEMSQLFMAYHSGLPADEVMQAMSNTQVIADRCEHYKIDKSPKIPKATKSTLEAERIIREWCREGLDRIGKSGDEVYEARLEEELDMLRKLKVFDYFVIVGDMVRWAKGQGIRVGPGRGSAAGSLVNYLIRITAIDPIGYGLLFERFLNEYRTEMPDIDIDFQHDRRDEVKQYLVDKWGSDYVVDVAAFQSFGFKGVIKDVARAMEISYGEAENATKDIPESPKLFGVDFEELEVMCPSVKAFFDKYPVAKKHCYRLYGQMKGQSVHAAAVVVTNQPAIDLIPLMKTKSGTMATQWSERANAQLISPYGFLKIDMLVTDALTIQANCIKLIKERHGITIDFEDPNQFACTESPLLTEQEVCEEFAYGKNLGVFQFASRGIGSFLKNIRPTNLEHLIAANALWRPGTIGDISASYSARKNGEERWTLPHEAMREFVESTYGFMIYQEQVMQIFRVLGKDVESSAAAVFLKVVAKGIARDLEGKQKLQKYYDIFAAGCEEKSILKISYDQVWDQILQMTTYSFNRSHAAGYALQAYQDMWLKFHYPLEFYSALLSIETDKVAAIIREARAKKVKVTSPDINKSEVGFTIDGDSIRFGLLAVKQVGDVAINAIKPLRPFHSYENFFERVPKQKVNKKVKSSLFLSGAFDSLGGRNEWVLNDEAMPVDGTMSDRAKAKGEKEVLGYSPSLKSEVEQYKDLIRSRIWTAAELQALDNQTDVLVGGEILQVKEHVTTRGDTMAFVDIDFEGDDYSLTFWSNKYADFEPILNEGAAIMAMGSWDPERSSILVATICTAEQLQADLNKETENDS